MLTCAPCRSRAVRAGYACRPPAYRTCPRPRAACPERHLYQPRAYRTHRVPRVVHPRPASCGHQWQDLPPRILPRRRVRADLRAHPGAPPRTRPAPAPHPSLAPALPAPALHPLCTRSAPALHPLCTCPASTPHSPRTLPATLPASLSQAQGRRAATLNSTYHLGQACADAPARIGALSTRAEFDPDNPLDGNAAWSKCPRSQQRMGPPSHSGAPPAAPETAQLLQRPPACSGLPSGACQEPPTPLGCR